MAPKSSFKSKSGDSSQKKSKSRTAMTTKEKIAAAEAKKSKEKKMARRPSGSLRSPTAAANADRPKGIQKKHSRKTKPLTTKEKLEAAEVAKKAKEKSQFKIDFGKAVHGEDGKKKAKPPVLTDMIEKHDSGFVRYVSKKPAPSVLVRPTERTKRLQVSRGEALQKMTEEATKTIPTSEKRRDIQFTDLPEDVRFEIWKLCVVYPLFFVWPVSPTGKEQPDIAMTSRSIRNSALPVYYGKNIFAIDISPNVANQAVASKKAKVGEPASIKDLKALKKWSSCLEKQGWFAMMRRWAFSYTPRTASAFALKPQDCDDGSFIVYVKFVARERSPSLKSWDANVEVHREARCVLPGAKECGQCIVQCAPEWLNKLVIEASNAAEGGDISACTILELAKGIKARASDLTSKRCVEVISSVEVESEPVFG